VTAFMTGAHGKYTFRISSRTSRFLYQLYGRLFLSPWMRLFIVVMIKSVREKQLYDGTFGKPRCGICPSRHVRSRILS